MRETSYVDATTEGSLPTPPLGSAALSTEGRANAVRFWRQVLQPQRRQLLAVVLSVVAASASTLFLGQALRALMDRGLATLAQHWGLVVAELGGAALCLALASYARFYSVSWLGERVVRDLRTRVFEHLLTLGPRFYETRPMGQILAGLTTDTTTIQVLFGTSLAIVLRNLILLIGGATLMVFTSAKLTWVMAGMLPVLAVFFAFYGRYVRRLARQAQSALGTVAATSEEALRAITLVQAYGREGARSAAFALECEEAATHAKRSIQARGMMTVAVILLVSTFFGIMLVMGGHELAQGRLTAGSLTSFLFYALIVAGTMGSMGELWGDVQRALAATDRLLGLLNTSSLVLRPAMLQATPLLTPRQPFPKTVGTVELDHVTFSYPSRPDTCALDDVSLIVHAGERVAIVGPSGAGKSTLFQLLLGFFTPDQGDVRLDGVRISEDPRAPADRGLGWVPQDPAMLSATVAENIAFGNPHATREQVVDAARVAYADGFIERLPQGYDTFIGEKGVRLSGGQRQRLALARALLINPAVLLLDEATSALDSESELEVQKGLAAAMAGRTSLVIAHRLSTVMDADRILVMDRGRVVASGRHAHLLATCPLYAQLARRQFHANLAEPTAGEDATISMDTAVVREGV